MKRYFEISTLLRRQIGGAAAALLLGSSALSVNAQLSPEGTWDCLISGGGQKGIAFITFTTELDSTGNYTLYGYEILTETDSSLGSSTDGRDGGDIGRGGDLGGDGGSSTNETVKVVGFGRFSGPWTYDADGRVIGNVVSEDFTASHSFSFVAKVRDGGQKLLLAYPTSKGKVVFRGVPAETLQDISGSWLAIKKESDVKELEFFSLQSSNPFDPAYPDVMEFPNIYFTTNGAGPGYTFFGAAAVSLQNRIGFVTREDGGPLRSTVGRFINDKDIVGGKTKGFSDLTPIKYKATLQAVP